MVERTSWQSHSLILKPNVHLEPRRQRQDHEVFLTGSQHSSHFGTEFPGSGFIQDLPVNKTESAELLQALRQNMWIDSNTKAIMATFTLFNGNLNRMAICQFLWEFLPTASIVTARDIVTFKPIRYITYNQ